MNINIPKYQVIRMEATKCNNIAISIQDPRSELVHVIYVSPNNTIVIDDGDYLVIEE